MVVDCRIVAVLALVCVFGPGFGRGFADEKNRRERAVRDDRKNLAADVRWLYNDVQTGFEAAQKLKKPLLIVLRCVPCKACTGIDESVLKSKDLQTTLDDFVCLRLINANSIDLSMFQFDYDLSFSAMIFHPEGKLIARYGSWQHQLDETETSTKSLQTTLQKATEIYREWDQYKDRIEPKQGGQTPFKTPIEIPGLAGKYTRNLDWDGNVVQSCVHCHQIGDAYRAWYRQRGERIPQELIYPMPDPITIGLKLYQDTGTRIRQVQQGSPADQAGMEPGDDITGIDGAPISSIADIAWALHRSGDPGQSVWTVQRNSKSVNLRVTLEQGWRSKSDIASRVGTWQMRAMVQGGMVLRSLDDAKRQELGLKQSDLGLIVHGLGEYGEHAAAKNAGFRKGDVVLGVQGIQGRVDESQLIGMLLALHPKPTRIQASVLRQGKHIELSWPIQ